MEHKALGKGLAALIPEKLEADNQKSPQQGVTYLAVSKIHPNPFQPRRTYTGEKLEELKTSIREKGILQPILVRKVGETYEVIAGERRLMAAQAVGLQEVPVVVRNVSDQEALILALIENIQREDLNPIEEAEALRRLIEEFQLTHDQVAQSVGKDRSTVTNMIRLLRLPDEIRKHVQEGLVSMGHARALLSIEDPQEQWRVCQIIVEKNLSVRELENISRVQASSPRKRKKVLNKGNDLVFLEEDLQKVLGTKVRIIPQRKRGKIIIEYYSPDDLERILEIIRN